MSDTDELNRRATDIDRTQEIEAMILEEDDKKYRTLLLVVQSLNNGIRENTAEQRRVWEDFIEFQRTMATQFSEYRLKLDAHLVDYSQQINKGKGVRMALGWGWKIVSGMAMALQAMILTIGSYYAHKLDAVTDAAQQNEVQHAQIEGKLQKFESEIERILP
jgi:hypothetical protein